MQLTRTSLRGMDVGNEWSHILERSPLRFAFDDGEVKAVCPHDGDPTWAVNIKRAILSAFQTKLGEFNISPKFNFLCFLFNSFYFPVNFFHFYLGFECDHCCLLVFETKMLFFFSFNLLISTFFLNYKNSIFCTVCLR